MKISANTPRKSNEELLAEKIAEVKSKNLKPAHEAKMIAMFEKKFNKKDSNKKWDAREAAKNLPKNKKWEGLTMAEINRMNAQENLPSSLR